MNRRERDNFDDLPILAELGELLERRFAESAQRSTQASEHRSPHQDADARLSVNRRRHTVRGLATTRTTTSRWLRTPRFARIRAVAAGLCAVLAVIVVIVGVSASHRAHHQPLDHNRTPASNGVASVPARVRTSFVSLRRPRQADDALPADALQRWLGRLPAGTLPNESRLVLREPTYEVWLVPGTTLECMLTWFTGSGSPGAAGVGTGGCVSPASADAVGIFSDGVGWGARNRTPPPAGYASLFAGILPAGTTSVTITLKDGTTQTLSADSQGAVAQPFLASDPITAASVISADGTITPIRSIAFGFNQMAVPHRHR